MYDHILDNFSVPLVMVVPSLASLSYNLITEYRKDEYAYIKDKLLMPTELEDKNKMLFDILNIHLKKATSNCFKCSNRSGYLFGKSVWPILHGSDGPNGYNINFCNEKCLFTYIDVLSHHYNIRISKISQFIISIQIQSLERLDIIIKLKLKMYNYNDFHFDIDTVKMHHLNKDNLQLESSSCNLTDVIHNIRNKQFIVLTGNSRSKLCHSNVPVKVQINNGKINITPKPNISTHDASMTSFIECPYRILDSQFGKGSADVPKYEKDPYYTYVLNRIHENRRKINNNRDFTCGCVFCNKYDHYDYIDFFYDYDEYGDYYYDNCRRWNNVRRDDCIDRDCEGLLILDRIKSMKKNGWKCLNKPCSNPKCILTPQYIVDRYDGHIRQLQRDVNYYNKSMKNEFKIKQRDFALKNLLIHYESVDAYRFPGLKDIELSIKESNRLSYQSRVKSLAKEKSKKQKRRKTNKPMRTRRLKGGSKCYSVE